MYRTVYLPNKQYSFSVKNWTSSAQYYISIDGYKTDKFSINVQPVGYFISPYYNMYK